MCYILISKNLKTEKPIERILWRNLLSKIQNNSDGFFIWQPNSYLRTLNINKAYRWLAHLNFRSCFLHFRQATSGGILSKNVHGWHQHGWQFFHNGIVSNYAGGYITGKNNNDDTDSFKFFLNVVKKIPNCKSEKERTELMAKTARDCGFYGRAGLYDSKNDKLYLLGDFNFYLINQNYFVLSSEKLSLKIDNEEKTIHGFSYSIKIPVKLEVKADKINGVGVILNFSTPRFEYQKLYYDELTRTFGFDTTATKLTVTDDDLPDTITRCAECGEEEIYCEGADKGAEGLCFDCYHGKKTIDN